MIYNLIDYSAEFHLIGLSALSVWLSIY